MKKCQNCGYEMDNKSKFCPKCGYSAANSYQDNNEIKETDKKSTELFIIIGRIFYIVAIADFILGNFFNVDITGVWWSPLLFVGIGFILESYAKKE
ncbi:MAG: zinc-ribbon domain-containing protein [Prevotella sp.]|nr:zinc-ribbon domain-containing protein [Prevotella sp.]